MLRDDLDVERIARFTLPTGDQSMRVQPLGDAALLIELGHAIDAATHARVRAAFDALSAAAIPGVTDIVPAYTGLAVHYDPVPVARSDRDGSPYETMRRTVVTTLEAVQSEAVQAKAVRAEAVRAEAVQAEAVPPGRTVEIAVRYGGEDGPDLDFVARHAGLAPSDVITLHSSAEYTVFMIGFTPGFPYLGGLPHRIATPRRASPRQAVPAGSVGIAGSQTGIYPLRTPGGWQIIGRTQERLFRPELDPPTLLRLGDRVRFIDASGA